MKNSKIVFALLSGLLSLFACQNNPTPPQTLKMIDPINFSGQAIYLNFYDLSNPTQIIPGVELKVDGVTAGISDAQGQIGLNCGIENRELIFSKNNYQTQTYRMVHACLIKMLKVYLVGSGNPTDTLANNIINGQVATLRNIPINGYPVFESQATNPPQIQNLTIANSDGSFLFNTMNRVESNLIFGPTSQQVSINMKGLNDTARIDVVLDDSSIQDSIRVERQNH